MVSFWLFCWFSCFIFKRTYLYKDCIFYYWHFLIKPFDLKIRFWKCLCQWLVILCHEFSGDQIKYILGDYLNMLILTWSVEIWGGSVGECWSNLQEIVCCLKWRLLSVTPLLEVTEMAAVGKPWTVALSARGGLVRGFERVLLAFHWYLTALHFVLRQRYILHWGTEH